MTTRISGEGPQPNVAVQTTAHRLTPTPSRPFDSFVDSGAAAVVSGAQAAATRLPGGPSIVAAVRGDGGGPGLGASGGSTGALTPTGEPGGAQPGDLETAISRQTEDSMYFLSLQQRIQNETRNFQAMSNVLKARHDSVKNAIGNLR